MLASLAAEAPVTVYRRSSRPVRRRRESQENLVYADLKAQIDAHRDLSTSLDLDREPVLAVRQEL
jgi:hypothetical protein